MAKKGDVGTLTVYMDAVTENFHAGLDGAEKKMVSFQGKIRGFSRTFTEWRSKLLMWSAAIEGGLKLVSVGLNALKGDWTAAADTLKKLPMGVGKIFEGLEWVIKTTMGWGDELEANNQLIEDMTVTLEASVRRLDKFRETMVAIREATVPVTDNIQLLEEGLRFTNVRMQQLLDLTSSYKTDWTDPVVLNAISELERGLERGSVAAQALALDLQLETTIGPILAELEELEKAIDRYETGVGSPTSVVAPTQAERDTHAQNVLTAAAREKQLAAVQRVFDLQEQTINVEETIAHAREQSARALAEQAEKAKELLSVQKSIASAEARQAKVAGRSLRGSSNTFSSPMGTISLPALNTTAELAREQLTELQKIESELADLNATVLGLDPPPQIASTAAPGIPMGTISLPSMDDVAELAREQVTELQQIQLDLGTLNTSILELSK